MGDINDAEEGLLTRKVKSAVAAARGPFDKAFHTSEHSEAQVTWAALAMILLIFVGLLAIILTTLHIEHRNGLTLREDSTKAPLNVIVVGDWGRQGQYNQSRVAAQMGRVGSELDVNFVISTGDNFYNFGLDSVEDPLFEESFSQIYQAPSLQKPWYAVLGNHDYRKNPDVQVDEQLRTRDSRWHCFYTQTILPPAASANGLLDSRSSEEGGDVEFFLIDTTPMQEYYWAEEDEKMNWTRSVARETAIADQLQYLTEGLEASTAGWKVVIGHHTIFSYGKHGDTPELISKVVPIMEANGVNMYINGHDHCLQHVKRSDSRIHYLTSGGGSKAWKGVLPPPGAEGVDFFYDGQGFVSLAISTDVLQANFYDITGAIIHQIKMSK